MKIRADREICASSGMCALTAPKLFDQDDDYGQVVLLHQVVPDPNLEEVTRKAIMLCPSGALSLDED